MKTSHAGERAFDDLRQQAASIVRPAIEGRGPGQARPVPPAQKAGADLANDLLRQAERRLYGGGVRDGGQDGRFSDEEISGLFASDDAREDRE